MAEKKDTRNILMPLTMAVSALLAMPSAGQLSEQTESRLQSAQVVAVASPAAAPQATLIPSGGIGQVDIQQGHRSHSSHASHRTSSR